MSEWIKLNNNSCKDCYKCIRHCRVNAIRFSGNLAYNVENLCVLCGNCYISCPQNAKVIVNDIEKANALLQTEKVIALVSPTYLAYFNTTYKAFKDALLKLGFEAMDEETLGYEIVTEEYNKILNEGKKNIYISSQCPSVNLLIQKYYKELLPNLVDIVSPMIAAAIDIKKRKPDRKVIYIGPCIAKKDEAERFDKLVDGVLMFDDIQNMFKKENIVLDENATDKKHFYARVAVEYGGIAKLLKDNPKYKYVSVSHIDNIVKALNEIRDGKLKDVFVIMDMCENSCLAGPTFSKYANQKIAQKLKMNKNYGEDKYLDKTYEKEELIRYFDEIKLDIKEPTKEELKKVLYDMGKDKPEKMLNCGTCGYSTCVAKAKAIFNGMAEIGMCTSYLAEKATSFSDRILANAPFAVIALNAVNEVQVFNNAAVKLFNLKDAQEIVGHPLSQLMDTTDIDNAYKDEKSQFSKDLYLSDYDKYITEMIVPDLERHNTILILIDTSDRMHYLKKKENIDKNTIEIADNVIEKQMKIVQEIASLLGETAAETKVALTKLKESLNDD